MSEKENTKIPVSDETKEMTEEEKQQLLEKFDTNVVAKAAILAEGDAAKRDDIVFLEALPLFFHD